MLQTEIIIIPLILIDQEIMKNCKILLWVLDVFWVTNMAIKLQTIRPEHPSLNPFVVAGSYIKSDFVFDLVATLPNILVKHIQKVIPLRGFHIIEISKANKPLQLGLQVILPNNRSGRLNMNQIIKFVYFILICVHYLICLWIWIGDKYLMNDPNKPWLVLNGGLTTRDAYFFVLYWIFTIITTVGYGDFFGGTTAEYLVSIVIEFGGFINFAVFTLLVNQLVESGFAYD
jgi:acetolactate synthase regulatory subunit